MKKPNVISYVIHCAWSHRLSWLRSRKTKWNFPNIKRNQPQTSKDPPDEISQIIRVQSQNGIALEAIVERQDVDLEAVEILSCIDKAHVEAAKPRESSFKLWFRSFPGTTARHEETPKSNVPRRRDHVANQKPRNSSKRFVERLVERLWQVPQQSLDVSQLGTFDFLEWAGVS